MNLTEEILKEAEDHAFNLMTLEEIAEIFEVNFSEFIKEYQKKGSLYKKIRRGRLVCKSTMQKSEIDLSHRGHASAQKSVTELIEKIERDDQPYQEK